MKKGTDKSLFVLILGIVLALAAGFLIVKGQEYYNQVVPVVYASENDIQPNTIISDSDVVIVNVPKVAVKQQSMFERKADVIGKAAKTLIPANTPVTGRQVIKIDQNHGLLAVNLTNLNNPELVAYTIPTTPIGTSGGKYMVNDTVHIIGTISVLLKAGEARKLVSKIIVPYAKIIDTVGTGTGMKGLTFALTPQQVLDIEYAMKNGTISFALLPYQANKDEGNEVTTEDSFVKRQLSK